VLAVEVTPRAARQLERAAAWWAENRTAAPDAIRVDFEEAKLLLARQPGVGAKSSNANYPDLRRVFLSRVRYHVYYRVWARESCHLGVLAFEPRKPAEPVIDSDDKHARL